MGRRKTLGLAGAALASVLAAGVLAISGGSSGGSGGAEASAAPTGTAVVQRRSLAETVTASGTIGYAGEAAAMARLSGTVTWLPAVGDVIRRGEPLYELGGDPVVLMYGTVPAYRELAEGVSDGADVRQLERNLDALGYEPGTVDGEFTSSTAAAVSAWQDDLGLAETGAVELGRVTFLPGPRRVTQVEADLGESIGSGGGVPAGLDEDEGSEGGAVLVAYEPGAEGVEPNAPAGEATQQPVPEPEGSPQGEEEAPGNSAPQDEAAPEEAKEGPEPAGEGGEPAGGAEEPAGEEAEPSSVPVLETSSTRRVVSVTLEPNQQSLAHRGQRVEVVLPDGREAKGKIERLAAAEAEEGAPGEETEAGVEATVVLTGRDRFPALDGASVSVVFTQRARKRVLAVPLTSLLAVGAGRYAVEAVGPGGRRRIEVVPGLAADGYVEVRGRGLREGMRVETGE